MTFGALLTCLSTLAAPADGPVIVAFGDSITLGVHLRSEQSYPSQLEALLRERTRQPGLRVVNAGIGGNTVTAGLARLDRDVLAHRPRFVLIDFGMNDSAMAAAGRPQTSLDDFTARLRAMLDRCRQAGATPLLATLTPVITEFYLERHPKEWYPGGVPAVLDRYSDAIRAVAKDAGVTLVDLRAKVPVSGLRTPANSGSRDGVHLTPAGCAAMAAAWAEALLPQLTALPVQPAVPARTVSLTSGRLVAEIDEQTGQLAALTDRRDGARLLERSADRYALMPDAKTELGADEAADRVVSRSGETFRATNPRLPGVTITKRYRVTDQWVEKRVEFAADRRDAGLLKYTTGSTAALGFWRDGYLNDPSRHPLDYPYLFAKDLTAERPMRDSHAVADHHWAIFCNPQQQRGLAQYRFQVDDRYVHPLSSYAYEPGLVYGPQGWRVAVAAKWLSAGGPTLAATCRWHLFDGDHLRFHQAYLALPEVRAEYAFDSPAWLRDVRRIMGWSWGAGSFNVARFKQAVEALDGGILMVMIGDVFCNTRRYLADPLVNADGLEVTPARLRRLVDDLHAISDRIKVGPITWQWAFGPADPVYRERPEWTVHDGAGQPLFAASGWGDEKVYSQHLTPACREHNLAQFRGMVKRYDFDFIYMDTGQGGVTRFDWTTHSGAQDYDWADFYRGIREAARSNRAGATFFNGTPQLYAQQADCGYFEGLGFVKVRDWRAMADRLLLVKLYQPASKWTVPLYWTADNLDEYANYCLLLGLKAGDFGGTSSGQRWPWAAAAEELAAMRLVPAADARPCWWQERTEAEAYALSLPGGAMLNVYQHAKVAGQVTASCAVGPLGLDATRPISAWLFEPRPVSSAVAEVALNEAGANDWYRRTGQAPHRMFKATRLGTLTARDGRVEVKLTLEPQRIGLVLLTQAPALAHAVNGRPTQLLLPPPAGATVQTLPADQPEPAALAQRRYAFRLPADARSTEYVPERSAPETVNHRETPVGRTVAGLAVQRLLTLDCEHNLADAASAEALADRLRLSAQMGDEKVYGFAAAGVEASNPGRVNLRLTLARPLYGRFYKTPAGFVGLTADYHTAAGYTSRVRFALAPCQAEALTNSRPWWGLYTATKAAPKQPWFVDLTSLLKPGETKELALDLGRWAPAEWDGQVLFGPVLESCGLGAGLTVEVVGNGPAGARDPKAFSVLPTVQHADGSVAFQGAAVKRFEDGARLQDGRIVFPPNGCLEGAGFKVITWQVRRTAASQVAVLMINYQLPDGKYQLVERDLGQWVKPGAESRFDLDLSQFAPANWNGRIRMRLRGDGLEAALVANSTFQIF